METNIHHPNAEHTPGSPVNPAPEEIKTMKRPGRQEIECWLLDALNYLGGSRDTAPPGFPLRGPVWRGLWWGLLAGAILLFCGQTSKFIYIDF